MLTEFIRSDSEHILQEWEAFARSMPGRQHMPRVCLRDHGPAILKAIAEDIALPQDVDAQVEKSRGHGSPGPLDHISQLHAMLRVDQGFEFGQLMAEYRALRATVMRLWQQQNRDLDLRDCDDIIRFNEAVDQLVAEAVNDHLRTIATYRDRSTAMLAHDLRTPLASISLSGAHLLKSGTLSKKHTKNVTRILASADRMHRMVGALLDFAGARFGPGICILPTPSHLGVVCEETLADIRAFYPHRRVIFDQAGDLRGTWDRDRLIEVVTNLVVNAIAHGNARGPVNVAAHAEGDIVELDVHNDGPPIPAKIIGVIFEPFIYNPGRDLHKFAGGLGLGLYIVKEVVRAHGGEVVAASSPESGTLFTVRLPRHAKGMQQAVKYTDLAAFLH